MKNKKFSLVCLLSLLVLGLVENFVPQANAQISFTKPTESSLWLTTAVPSGLYNTHFWSLATNEDHNVIAPFPYDSFKVYSLSDTYSQNVNLGVLDFLQTRHANWTLQNRLIGGVNDNATITFSGFQVQEGDEYTEGTRNMLVFIPHNTTGVIADFDLNGINLAPPFSNFIALSTLDFQFASAGDYNWQTGQTTAAWNSTMQAIIASSISKPGYTAFTIRKRADTTGSWTPTYSIWNSSSAFNSWMSSRWALDNSTNGSLPTTSTNVLGALAYNNTSTSSGIYKLHFTVYFTFANTMNQLNTNLNNLLALNPQQSYIDSNTYWYNLYTQYSAVNFGNDNLNKLYYWTKHLVNVGHWAKRLMSAGAYYQCGYLTYFQDASYGAFSSDASGLWENTKRFLDYSLLYGIDTIGTSCDGFDSGTPYNTKNMMGWTITPYGTTPQQNGTVRASLDFLDSVINYVAWSGNTTFTSTDWLKLTNIIEAIHDAVTVTGVLPLTKGTEDTDSSLQCNIIYYHALKEFASLSRNIGNGTYGNTLDLRASALKTQLNKEVGSGGLWSSLVGYFVNASTVSPSDANPKLYSWHNALAMNYDIANSDSRKASILSAIESKTETDLGFNEHQFISPARIWYMKNYEIAKAYANMENSSKISEILWSMINNPYSGLTETGSYTRFNFPEFWAVSGGAWGVALQYAWSSSPATMTMEVLLGIKPSINNIKIQPIKPSNVSTVTVINVKVRDALWNVSVSGDGNYVNSVAVDNSILYSQAIPSSYYTGSHTIEVTLGTKGSPQITESTSQIVVVSYVSDKMSFTVSEVTGVTSITKVYVGDKGQPANIAGASSWSYNSTTKILTINVIHSSEQQVEISWEEGSGGGYPKQAFETFLTLEHDKFILPNKDFVISGSLYDALNKPIPNEPLWFLHWNGTQLLGTTNDLGNFVFTIKAPNKIGTYGLTVMYDGTDLFLPTMKGSTFTVVPVIPPTDIPKFVLPQIDNRLIFVLAVFVILVALYKTKLYKRILK